MDCGSSVYIRSGKVRSEAVGFPAIDGSLEP